MGVEESVNNEVGYLSAWTILRQAYMKSKIDKEILERVNERVAIRLSVNPVKLKEGC